VLSNFNILMRQYVTVKYRSIFAYLHFQTLMMMMMMMTENRMLRRIFRLQRQTVTRGWGKLHNEKLHNLNSSQIIIRMI